MKSRTIIAFSCLILTIFAINSQFADASVSSITNAPGYSGLRINNVILHSNNLTFEQHDNISIFMLVENIGTENVRDVNFTYTVDTTLFAIIQSSNTTQSSNKTVYYSYPILNPGTSFSFNMTLFVVTNKTNPTVSIPGVVINYKYSEFMLPSTITSTTLTVNIQGISTSTSLQSKVLGSIQLDNIVLGVLVAFPIVLAFVLSFIYGRRRNKL